MSQIEEHQITYDVVVNAEEQYSLWPTFKPIPEGWDKVGMQGTKEACLQHIKTIWTDMRPLSLRKKMEERLKSWDTQRHAILSAPYKTLSTSPTVLFLSQGVHPVTLHPACKTSKELHSAIERGTLHVTFTGTQGKTTLSISLNAKKTSQKNCDFIQAQGEIHLEGTLVLDGIHLTCVVDIQLSTLEGQGCLIIPQQ